MFEKRRHFLILFGALIFIGIPAIPFSFLHAAQSPFQYSDTPTKLYDGTLTQLTMKQNETTLCTYPREEGQALCDGFIQEADGIYKTKEAAIGTWVKDVFEPYSYEIRYELDGVEETQTFRLSRAPGSAIIAFTGGEVSANIEEPLNIVGTYHKVEFQCEDAFVKLENGNVVANEQASSFQVKAMDDGDEHYEGGEVVAQFQVAKANDAILPITDMKLGRAYDPGSNAIWQSGRFSAIMETTLSDSQGAWSQPQYKDMIRLQGQFINLSDGTHDLKGKQPNEMSLSEVNELFKGVRVDDGSAIDNAKDQYLPGTTTWVQYLTLKWPQEEGIFLYRYRLFDTDGWNPIWENSYDDSLIVDKVDEGWIFDPYMVIGQDFTPPELSVDVKRKSDTTWRALVDGEELSANDQIRLTASDSLSDITLLKYKVALDGENAEFVTSEDVHEAIITLPNNYKGGTIYAEAQNGCYENGATKVSYDITANTSFVNLGMPKENLTWAALSEGMIRLQEPTQKVDYDGVLVTFVGSDEPSVFISKQQFYDHENTYTIAYPNGTYTLQAVVVKKNGDSYTQIDYNHTFESKQKIDHTISLTAQKEALVDHTLPITLTATSGPSKLKEITMSCTGSDHTTWSKTIPITNDVSQSQVQDIISVNGNCSYTAYNNAGKASTPQQVIAVGLDEQAPNLKISAMDKNNDAILSGKPGDTYVKVKAENLNSAATQKIQVCVNDTCLDYTYGTYQQVNQNAMVTFRKKEAPNTVYGTFQVVLKQAAQQGTLQIEQAQAYTTKNWYKDDQNIHAYLEGNEEGVAIAYKINGDAWIKSGKTDIKIPIVQAKETSKTNTLQVKSYKDGAESNHKSLTIQIDKVTPTLTLNKQKEGKLVTISMQAHVGGSEIKTLKVKTPTDTLSLNSSILADGSLQPFEANKNGTYVFTLTNGVGVSTSTTTTISEIDDTTMHVDMKCKDENYTGSWSKYPIDVALSGGGNKADHFECKIGNGEWSICDANQTISDEREATYYYRVVDAQGNVLDTSGPHTIRIDQSAPAVPNIQFKKVNEGAIQKMLNAMSFAQYFKEAMQVSITSEDALSKVSLYYQVAAKDGTFEQDLSSSKWMAYTKAIDFDKEGAVKIAAYACDEANNCSSVIDSDHALLDFQKPILTGISQLESEGYIPRRINYEDQGSGIDEASSKLTYQEKDITLSQQMMIKDVGDYQFYLYDKAGNKYVKAFRLLAFSTPEDIDGSDESRDTIDGIIDEFEKNKDNLDEATKKEIEEKIKDLENALQKNRVTFLEDETTGATLQGLDGTTFPKQAILRVRLISKEMSKQEKEAIVQQADPLYVADVYEVSVSVDGKEVALSGKAQLLFAFKKPIEKLIYVNDGWDEKTFEKEQQQIKVIIEQSGRYAGLTSDETLRFDPADSNDKDDDPNQGNGSGDNKDPSNGGGTNNGGNDDPANGGGSNNGGNDDPANGGGANNGGNNNSTNGGGTSTGGNNNSANGGNNNSLFGGGMSTGDTSDITLWIGLLLGSGILLNHIRMNTKQRNRRI